MSRSSNVFFFFFCIQSQLPLLTDFPSQFHCPYSLIWMVNHPFHIGWISPLQTVCWRWLFAGMMPIVVLVTWRSGPNVCISHVHQRGKPLKSLWNTMMWTFCECEYHDVDFLWVWIPWFGLFVSVNTMMWTFRECEYHDVNFLWVWNYLRRLLVMP